MIVIDASAFIASVMEDEVDDHKLKIRNIVKQDNSAIVPPLFYYETANVLLKSLRRKRITKSEYENHLELLLEFPLIVDEETPVYTIARLAEKYHLSFYDASYLELSIRGEYSLATFDTQLREAAKKTNTKLVIKA